MSNASRGAGEGDLKKQFDDVSQAASDMAKGNLLTSTAKEVEDALSINTAAVGTPTTPEPPTAETHQEATVHEAVTETPSQLATYQPVDKAS